FNGVANDLKLALLNFLGEFADNNLSLEGFTIDIAGGDDHLRKDRARFTAGSREAFDRMRNTVAQHSNYAKNPLIYTEHPGFDVSYRERTRENSSQIGFGTTPQTYLMIEIDIDIFNPSLDGGDLISPLQHLFGEVLKEGKTEPYQVANKRFWECKPVEDLGQISSVF
ncbi:MAG: hypothetical protein ACRD6X_17655, partial [Pyrinomonadaceae bacterium]